MSEPVIAPYPEIVPARWHVWLTCGCGGVYDLPGDAEFPMVVRCHFHGEDRTTVSWQRLDARNG